jgi:hypothetical protein
MKADISDITKKRGIDAARAHMDSARPFPPKDAIQAADEEKTSPPAILFKPTPFVWRAPELIKRREWLFAQHYIRKYVTATIGRRGGGKTTRAIAEMLSMATGRDLLQGGQLMSDRLRVWYIGEDTHEEIERRIVAACVHHNIKPDDIIGNTLFFNSVLDLPRGATKLVTVKRGDVVRNEDAIHTLKAGIAANNIDVLLLDPLKKFHSVQENANDQMDEVMSVLSEIAMESNVAIELLHHTRKPYAGNTGAPMTVDDGRGADAIIAAARSARIVNGMLAKEAEEFGIPKPEAWRYTRTDNGKANMAPPGEAAWARSASVPLPCGESVGVLENWRPPAPFTGVTINDMELAIALARTGEYRADSRSPAWFGYPLAKEMGIKIFAGGTNDKQDIYKINSIIKTWLKNGVLDTEGRKDEKSVDRAFIVVGPKAKSTTSRSNGAEYELENDWRELENQPA